MSVEIGKARPGFPGGLFASTKIENPSSPQKLPEERIVFLYLDIIWLHAFAFPHERKESIVPISTGKYNIFNKYNVNLQQEKRDNPD